MPINLQVHRQVLQSKAKISSKTRNTFYKLLQKYDAIISKSINDIGQTDLIVMYIATRLEAAPIEAQPYPLAPLTSQVFEAKKKSKTCWMQELSVKACPHGQAPL